MIKLLPGDCLQVLATLPENSVDSIVTDPPAGIGFMGRDWDKDKGGRDHWIAWMAEVAAEALRVIKPGGHALVWALPRTSHWTATAWENAGWVPRDRLAHLFGSGFPKGHDISKAIDRMLGGEREQVGTAKRATGNAVYDKRPSRPSGLYASDEFAITAPATDAARQWDGWNVALKPAMEDWWLFRKPLSESTVAANVLRWSTGGLNIAACRVGSEPRSYQSSRAPGGNGQRLHGGDGRDAVNAQSYGKKSADRGTQHALGRWPANVLHDGSDEVVSLFPETGPTPKTYTRTARAEGNWLHAKEAGTVQAGFGDSGSAARFFKSCPWTDEENHQREMAQGRSFMYPVSEQEQLTCNGTANTAESPSTPSLSTCGKETAGSVHENVATPITVSRRESGPRSVTSIRGPIDGSGSGARKAAGSRTSNLSTGGFGSANEDLFRTDTKSTTSITTVPTTAPKTYPSSAETSTTNIINACERHTEQDQTEPSIASVSAAANGSQHPSSLSGREEPSKATANHVSANTLPSGERPIGNIGTSTIGSEEPSRLFYCPKASRADRAGSRHPTIKPIKLMRYLVRLVTPPGGTVLDVFAGSGTTGAAAKAEGFNAILIEREPEYQADIERRLWLQRDFALTA